MIKAVLKIIFGYFLYLPKINTPEFSCEETKLYMTLDNGVRIFLEGEK